MTGGGGGTSAGIATLGDACGRAWDAVVVGAGPAGATAAYALARMGLSVCLLDRAVFPRSKPCGCCINSAALEALAGLGLGGIAEDAGAAPIHELDLTGVGCRGRRARLSVRGGVVLSRDVFDAALVRAAQRAGAAFLDGAMARLGALARDGRVVRVQRAGHSALVRARIVIAADGIAGTLLRDEPDFQAQVHARSYIGAAVTLASARSLAEPRTGVISMTCGIGGYVGAGRLRSGELHIAAAMDPARVREAGGPGALAREILARAQREEVEGLSEAHWRGTPTLTRQRRLEGERLMVIGDAAGYVEPFTGEGMAWAIASGAAVAPLVRAAVHGTDVRGAWARRHAELIGRRQRLCRAAAWTLRRPTLVAAIVRAVGLKPALAMPALRSIERGAGAVGIGGGA